MRDVDWCYAHSIQLMVCVSGWGSLFFLDEFHRKTFTIWNSKKKKNQLGSRIQIKSEVLNSTTTTIWMLFDFKMLILSVESSSYLFWWAFVMCLLPPAPKWRINKTAENIQRTDNEWKRKQRSTPHTRNEYSMRRIIIAIVSTVTLTTTAEELHVFHNRKSLPKNEKRRRILIACRTASVRSEHRHMCVCVSITSASIMEWFVYWKVGKANKHRAQCRQEEDEGTHKKEKKALETCRLTTSSENSLRMRKDFSFDSSRSLEVDCFVFLFIPNFTSKWGFSERIIIIILFMRRVRCWCRWWPMLFDTMNKNDDKEEKEEEWKCIWMSTAPTPYIQWALFVVVHFGNTCAAKNIVC